MDDFSTQITMPLRDVINGLNSENISYKFYQIDPTELNPTQGLVFSHSNCKEDNDDPIFLDNQRDIIDGHHRWTRRIECGNKPIKCIEINLPKQQAIRVLNKIQDIYDFKNSELSVNEEPAQDVINAENDIDSGIATHPNEFIPMLEETIDEESFNKETVIGYRKDPINETSVIGNFFSLNPINGYKKYEVEFDNLLETDTLGINLLTGQKPVEMLSKAWFPHIDFEKVAQENDTDSTNLKYKAIAEKAKSMGYDGIKYGNKLLQGF